MNRFFFYGDLAAKRRLRRWLKATLITVIVVNLTLSACALAQGKPAAEVPQTPQPVAITVVPTNTPVPPTPTFTPSPSPTPEACPTDPAEWSFSIVEAQGRAANKGWFKIRPTCVYDGLAKTVAWVLMTTAMGYPGPEAAQALGFEAMPIALTSRIKINYLGGGPNPVELYFPISVSKNYVQWMIWRGKPSFSFWLGGCYETKTVVGNQVESWAPYPVLCTVQWQGIVDPVYAVRRLDQQVETHKTEGSHTGWGWSIFAYDPARGWLYLGDVKGIGFRTAVGEPCPFCEETLAEHGVPLWNADWLEQTYGIAMKPLPQGWESAPDHSEELTYRWWVDVYNELQKNPDWW